MLALGPLPKSAMGHGDGFRWRPESDWVLLVREKERPGVNLSALWQESRRCYRQ